MPRLLSLAAATALLLLGACSGDDPPTFPLDPPPALPAGVEVVTTASGLQYADITVGTGDVAEAGDLPMVQYTLWTAEGRKIQATLPNQPFVFRIGNNEVIAGFDEGVRGMRVGGKRRLLIPWELAYGTTGSGPIPGRTDIIFDVELTGFSI